MRNIERYVQISSFRDRKTPLYINSWKEMEGYGFNGLTGEACGIGYRYLVDLDQAALDIVQRTIGAAELKAPSNYNSGSIASLLLPYSMLEPLAVMTLFLHEKAKVQRVVVDYHADTYSGKRIIGFSADWSREDIELLLTQAGVDTCNIYTYPEQRPGITEGASNVHQFTGRKA